MQLHEARVVREAYGERAANELLNQGWTLLTVVSGYDPLQATQAACYVFAQGEERPEPAGMLLGPRHDGPRR